MDMQMPKSLASRKSHTLSSIDNNSDSQRYGSLHDRFTPRKGPTIKTKNQQYLAQDDKLQKENRPPSGFSQPLQRTPSHSDYPHARYPMSRSIGANSSKQTTLRQHSSTGGKTISSSLMKKVSQTCRGVDNGTSSKNNNDNINPLDRSSNRHRCVKQKQRAEQRMSPEHLKLLSRRIDPSLPASTHGSPSKPILPSIFTNDADHDKLNSSHHHLYRYNSSISSSLYQTCIDLWPSEPTLGDFASDNIKNLTNLLKFRLSQAKYRVLADLEEDDNTHTDPSLLSTVHILRDGIDYSTWPSFEKHTIKLSNKRSCGSVSVSGNGARLFRQSNSYLQSRRLQQQKQQYRQDFGLTSSHLTGRTTPMNHYHPEIRGTVSLPPPSPSNYLKSDLKKKRKLKTKPAEKVLRCDGRDQAAKLSPVKLEDGSMAFVCAPCNKKYKTRNGMAYHLDRCAHQPPPINETTKDERTINHSQQPINSSESPGSKSSGVHCVCDHPTDDEEMMVKCDECQLWLHLDCVGTNDGVLDDIYHCPRCITADYPATKRTRLSTPKQQENEQHTMASLIFQQLDNTTTPDLSTSNHLLPLSLDATTKSSPFHSQSSSTLPLWDNLDLLDSNPISSSSANITTSSISDAKNEDAANIWGLPTVDIPSLLYSDATTGLPSTIDEEYLPNDLPSSELSVNDLPPTDWFQFANFDDDFLCDDPRPAVQ